MTTSWRRFAEAAPSLAVAIQARFTAHRHHIIGTVREDGAPRLGGTEVVIGDEVRIGVMPGSHRLRDVLRDPRVEVHSAPLEEGLEEGDAKLAGRLVDRGPVGGTTDGSWFALDIERASLVRADRDVLVLTVWRPGSGVVEYRRR